MLLLTTLLTCFLTTYIAETELHVNFTVPELVLEGKSFTPRITVSSKVIAEFLVYASPISAVLSEDFEFSPEIIEFGPTDQTLTTSSIVTTFNNNKAEADKQFTISIELALPTSLAQALVIDNPSTVVTILDTTS